MVYKVLNKAIRVAYKLFHPVFWNKGIEINGIPIIPSFKKVKFGHHISFNAHVYIQGSGGVFIGNYVTLSRGAEILTVGLNTKGYPSNCYAPRRPHILKPVVIGDGVWLGARAMVMPGVTIAPKIIVAAGSVVTHDLDKEGWLYAGVPAVPIRELK